MKKSQIDDIRSATRCEDSYCNVWVPRDRYLEIIGFTTYAYLTGKITKYSGMAGGRIRTLGEFIENFIYGKIAEEAFKLFLEGKLDLHTLTEVDVAGFYVGMYLPDIVATKVGGKWVPAKFWVDVKEVRRDQKWSLITASSVRQRPYDAYVAVWVGLPEEHVAWLVEKVPGVKKKMSREWRKRIEETAQKIDRIPCKICGFANYQDVASIKPRTDKMLGRKGSYYFDGKVALFDPSNPSWSGAVVGENLGFTLEKLKKESNWREFASLLEKNKKIIPRTPLPTTKSGDLSKKSGLPLKYGGLADYREASQAYFADQLSDIEKRFGKIQRTTSWFSQPLS